MLINVAFNGKKLFEYAGDADAIARAEDEVMWVAERGNAAPRALAHATVREVSHKGGFSASNPEFEMALVTWWLISQPTNNPDRPGVIRDYLDMCNFDFNVTANPDGRSFKFSAVASDFTVEGAA